MKNRIIITRATIVALLISVSIYAYGDTPADVGNVGEGSGVIETVRGSEDKDNITVDNGTMTEDDLYILEDMHITERVYSSEIGRTDISREIINNMPRGKNNITDLLTVVPGVQFSESHRSASSIAEIAPAEVSISGGKFYDNLFIIDGMSNSSRLDPAGSDSAGMGASGHSQKFFLSSWLVEDLTVYDSNISAQYTGFGGGVVEVKTRRPSVEKFGGSIAYRTTRNSWVNFHIDDGDYMFAAPYGFQKAPEFRTDSYSAAVNVPLTDKTAFIFDYGRVESIQSKPYFGGWKNEYRLSETYRLKGVYNIDGSSYIEATGSYAPYSEDRFLTDVARSNYTVIGGGYFASANYNKETGSGGSIIIHTDYSFSENTQDGPKDKKSWIASESKPWGILLDPSGADNGTIPDVDFVSVEGGEGSIIKSEREFNLSLTHALDRIPFLGEQNIKYGLNYGFISGIYNRKETSYNYMGSTESYDVICNGDFDTCVDGEQYLSYRRVDPESYVDADINTYSGFIENTWLFKRLQTRIGVSVSYDDFLSNLDLGPRLQMQYDIFGNRNTVVTAGYNRYYHGPLLANKLREGRKPWYDERRWTFRNQLQDWVYTAQIGFTSYNFSELDTPYDDEYSVGIEQKLFGGTLAASYIEKRGKNYFAQETNTLPDGVIYYSLNNNGASEYRSASMKWSRSWKKHSVMANWTWSESSSSNDTYNTLLGLEKANEEVMLDGKLIKLKDLPSSDYNRPLVINFAYTGRYFDHLLFGVNLKYRGKYTDLTKGTAAIEGVNPETMERELVNIDSYTTIHVGDAFYVDCSFAWEQPVMFDHKLTVTFEIANILNTKNKVKKSSGTSTYETGRQFWLGAEYEF